MMNFKVSYVDMKDVVGCFCMGQQDIEIQLKNFCVYVLQFVLGGFVIMLVLGVFDVLYVQFNQGVIVIIVGIEGMVCFFDVVVQLLQLMDEQFVVQICQ